LEGAGEMGNARHDSVENYLETILMLGIRGEPVRSIDIVNKLEYTRPSVSIAMKKLRESGFIEVDCDGHITLTKEGQVIAESIYEKHVIICRFLKYLGVDSDTAFNDACKIEHVISEQSFSAIKKHVERIDG